MNETIKEYVKKSSKISDKVDLFEKFLKLHKDARKNFEKDILFEDLPIEFLTEDKEIKLPYLLKAINKHFKRIMIKGINMKKL